MLGARDEIVDPRTKKMAERRMARARPLAVDSGPAHSAPRRPPNVKIEETTANCASSMAMQSGSHAPESSSVW